MAAAPRRARRVRGRVAHGRHSVWREHLLVELGGARARLLRERTQRLLPSSLARAREREAKDLAALHLELDLALRETEHGCDRSPRADEVDPDGEALRRRELAPP